MNLVHSFSRKIFMAVIAISIAIEGMAIIVNSAWAQAQPTPSSDDQVNAIASQLYCPVCENITLDVCSTQACAQWRDLIRDKLGQGDSPAQIKDYFVQQYGDRVLAVPPRTGLNWLLYLLPPLIFLAALILMVRFFMKHRSLSPAVPESEIGEGTSPAKNSPDASEKGGKID
jgi:cytochrome c-type biogenesis protein CcmH